MNRARYTNKNSFENDFVQVPLPAGSVAPDSFKKNHSGIKVMKALFILFLFLTVIPGFTVAQSTGNTNWIPPEFCISSMEYRLYTMINSYRERYELPPIPLSKALCYVAETHVMDLVFHHPDKGSCNAHSWSDQGKWKPFCYPRDENKKNSVWDKPKELTDYKGKGYEIVYWENSPVVVDSIIELWKSMDYFNSFLMNTGTWQGKKWNAIGIGIYENYACAWFGEVPDPNGEPASCGQEVKPSQPAPEEVTVPTEKNEPAPKVVKEALKKKPVSAPIVKTESQKPGKDYYYIIVRGQSGQKEMQRVVNDLKSRGYPDAKILESRNLRRVSIMEFRVKPRADSALRQVKKTWTDAWILKQ